MTFGAANWRRRIGLGLVAAIAVLSFAGLRAAAGQSATDPGASASRAKTEGIVSFAFRPIPLAVSRGTTVVFSNRSNITHTATQNGGGFDTGRIRAGKSASVTFKRAGTYLFHCTIHPFMHGKIIVR